MNELKPAIRHAAAYENDYSAWTAEQARHLRRSKPTGVDWENLAEEVESLGRSDKRAVGSALKIVLEHLIKWQFQPASDRQAGAIQLTSTATGFCAYWKTAPALPISQERFWNASIAGGAARRFGIPASPRSRFQSPVPFRLIRHSIPTFGRAGTRRLVSPPFTLLYDRAAFAWSS